jgi:hypothetical protein
MTKLSTTIKKIIDEKNKPFDYSYQKFIEDNKSQKEHFERYQHFNSLYLKELKLESDYLKFIIEKNSQLVLTLEDYFNYSKKAKKDYKNKSYSYRVLNDFWKIFIVITNNYISLADLFLKGFDFQAQVIFRNTIELTEICIGILGNEEFYNFFKTQNHIDTPDAPFRTMKYVTLRKINQRIIDQIKSLKNNNLPQEVWDEYLQARQHLYEKTSRHVHANFLNLMFGSHVPIRIETPKCKGDFMLMNLGGLINDESKNNIKKLAYYDSVSYMILMILLIEMHELNFGKMRKNVEYLTILSTLNRDLVHRVIRGLK